MSSWDIYWLLKLDDIREAANSAAAILGFLFVVSAFIGLVATSGAISELPKWAKRTILSMPVAIVFLITAYTFLPGTKQMAAIMIVPRVATAENMEAVSAETKEVYGMFKQWLKDQVEEPEKESKQ